MRVGIIQSCYAPWRGYFDFIASVDRFVFLDDVQYTRRDWRNRNRLKSASGPIWISVPVHHGTRGSEAIDETRIDYSGKKDWRARHLDLLRLHYDAAPHVGTAQRLLDSALGAGDDTISALNIRLTRTICDYLGIRTELLCSRHLRPEGGRTARLIAILRRLGAARYLSGPSADAYLDKRAIADAGIALEYKSYDYPDYPQQWGGFIGDVSVLDLIANCGPGSRELLCSRTADRVVAPPPG